MLRVKPPKMRYMDSSSLITISVALFIILYNVPITLVMPGVVRKPLLIIGLLLFIVALCLENILYLSVYLLAAVIIFLYFQFSWSLKLDAASYIFPAMVSIEMLFSMILIYDKKIRLPDLLIKFLIFVTVITAVTSIIGLIKVPTGIRALGQAETASNASIRYMLRKSNVAGWGLLFGMAFFEGPLLHLYKQNRKAYILFVFAVNGACVFLSQLAFAILLSASTIFFVLINGKQKQYKARMSLFLILFLGFCIAREKILTWLYELMLKTNLSVLSLRMKNIYDLILFHDTTGDAGGRFELYSRSIETFFKNPFGLQFADKVDIYRSIGFHSEFFDLLGVFGIFSVIGIVLIALRIKKRINRIVKIDIRRFSIIMLFAFLIMCVINPVFYHPQIWLSALLVPAVICQEYMKSIE